MLHKSVAVLISGQSEKKTYEDLQYEMWGVARQMRARLENVGFEQVIDYTEYNQNVGEASTRGIVLSKSNKGGKLLYHLTVNFGYKGNEFLESVRFVLNESGDIQEGSPYINPKIGIGYRDDGLTSDEKRGVREQFNRIVYQTNRSEEHTSELQSQR